MRSEETPEEEIVAAMDGTEGSSAESPAHAPSPETDRLPRSARVEIAKGLHYFSKGTHYLDALWKKWDAINVKFHIIGWEYDENPEAWREMFQELVTFLYEIAGQVPKEQKVAARDLADAFVDEVERMDELRSIRYLFNEISNWIFESRIGLKPEEAKVAWDFDADEVFASFRQRREASRRVRRETDAIVEEVRRP